MPDQKNSKSGAHEFGTSGDRPPADRERVTGTAKSPERERSTGTFTQGHREGPAAPPGATTANERPALPTAGPPPSLSIASA